MKQDIYFSFWKKGYLNQCFLRAHRRFHLEQKGVEVPEEFEKRAFSGSVVHECIELWFKNRWYDRFAKEPIEKHKYAFNRSVVVPILHKIKDEHKVDFSLNPKKSYHSEVWGWLNFFFDKVWEIGLYVGRFHPELKMRYSREYPDAQLSVGGRIDLVYESPDSKLWVLDWKGTNPDYINEAMDEQLMFYGLGVKEKFGRYPDGSAFLFFKARKFDFKRWTEDQYNKLLDDLLDVGKKFESGPWDPSPSFKCTFCEYANDCEFVSLSIAKKRNLLGVMKKFNDMSEGPVSY